MFTILAIGDPHFKNDNGETTEELTTKTLDLIRARIDTLDAVVILGDILHRHEKIDLHPFYRAMGYLQQIHNLLSDYKKKEIFLYIIIGNHDRSNNRVFMTDEHVFNPLKQWKNTIVADKALLHKPRKDFQVLLVPYVPPGRFQEAYESVISEKDLEKRVNLVLAHQEFHGAKMNLITSNEGDPWDSLKPLCVSGHIHDYQILRSNLIYTGTPIQHGFADIGKKTVSIYNLTYITEPDDSDHDVPGPTPLELSKVGFTEERIDLGIRGRTTVKGNIRDFDALYFPIDDFFVKAKLQGTKREIKTFSESKKYQEAVRKGIIFQFLEVPTIEVGDSMSMKRESEIQKIRSGKSFSERLRETLSGLESGIKDEYKKIFNQ